jgi:hypothetical protein
VNAEETYRKAVLDAMARLQCMIGTDHWHEDMEIFVESVATAAAAKVALEAESTEDGYELFADLMADETARLERERIAELEEQLSACKERENRAAMRGYELWDKLVVERKKRLAAEARLERRTFEEQVNGQARIEQLQGRLETSERRRKLAAEMVSVVLAKRDAAKRRIEELQGQLAACKRERDEAR